MKGTTGDELGAAEMARRVAEVVKKLRTDRRLSLDALASRSGVSRAALSQIEGARTNPTLAVLWKIAVGLDVPFHDLLGTNDAQDVRVLRAGHSPPLKSADGRVGQERRAAAKFPPLHSLELVETARFFAGSAH